MNCPVTASPRAERLLVEILCRRDEAAGHPLESAAADLGAIRAGGDLAQRIRTRALRLPGSDDALAQIDRVLMVGRALIIALFLIATIAGVTAASVALGEGRDLNIPLVLLALVGLNVFMLLLWAAVQVTPLRAPFWLVMLWSGWVRRLSGATSASSSSAGVEAIRVISQGPGARWRFGAVLHGAWLAYTVAGLLTLVVQLVVRRYDLTWQTTLLSAEGLRELAELLSVVPRLLGASGPDQLSLSSATSVEDHRGWARWLLVAVLVYGVVPRLVALIVCVVLALRTEPRWHRELARPGYARLRDRLMPDRREQVVVDAASSANPPMTALQATVPLPAESALHGVTLEWPDAAPERPSPTWRWFGAADDLESRAAVLARLCADPVAGLVVVVRATATPDRGLQRFVADMAKAARATTWIALGEIEALDARGDGAGKRRIDDWRNLAANAGASGGLLAWDERRGAACPLESRSDGT